LKLANYWEPLPFASQELAGNARGGDKLACRRAGGSACECHLVAGWLAMLAATAMALMNELS